MIKRYLITLISSMIRSIISFSASMFIARNLGPKEYGKLSFLLGTFVAIRQILDMGTSQAFFSFMSKKIRSLFFISTYLVWLFLQFIIVFVIIFFILKKSWIDFVWNGETKIIIFLAFSATFIQNTIWPSMQQALESQRKTITSQKLSLIVALFHLIAMILLWHFSFLEINYILEIIFFEYLIAILFAFYFLNFIKNKSNKFEYSDIKNILFKYYNYCKPLFLYSWLGFGFAFLDTWLLQFYGGSNNQAFLVVSSQISAIALLATSSFTNIFFKEAVDAFSSEKFDLLRNLYASISKAMFFVSCIIGAFFIPWSKYILIMLLGEQYQYGYITFAIMLLYPIYQSLGQINGLLLFAMNEIRLHAKVGIYFMLFSSLITTILVTQVKFFFPSFHYFSELIAVKLVTLQFLQVIVLSIVISRKLKLSLGLLNQVVSIFGLLFLSFLAKYFSIFISFSLFNFDLSILFAGLIYLIFIVFVVYLYPKITGFTKTEINERIFRIFNGILGYNK